MKENFNALVVNKTDSQFLVDVKTLTLEDLSPGDVTVKVAYSSVNYKDGLASIPNGKILDTYPFVPGIDMAGTVVASKDSRFKEGDKIIATSYEIGIKSFGGFSEYARLKGDWIVPLPDGLSLIEAMAFGTAGFTAALSIQRLQDNGINPDKGEVLVTGATGGVGSLAVSILSKLGYYVVASTGKESEYDYLKSIGANEVISREEVNYEKIPALGKQRWAGAVDPVGGNTLASILSNCKYGASVAVSGLTGGPKVPTTVFPFILRGINLLGIDSAYCPMNIRKPLWNRMANEMKPETLLSDIGQEITLEELPSTLEKILKGQARGRSIVKL
ncbi:NADPH:quinone oxidoreductase family protein [Fredinandcohnia onubensis]|uniref:NADPH:quinone oxidoreductase family protein n=1 Tax=Fredinandcohnia onubensis TaxID=1571209 RepID=UPI002481D869|nr:acryloyl-CoA reductase [Fredinandcohnia onubensis]